MKKILLVITLLIISCGCTNINNADYKDIINESIKSNYKNKYYNTYHNGYKYYLPKYMSVKSSYDFNEKINSNDYTYYLYLDIVSYKNKYKLNYEENDNYISYKFNYKDIDGYVDVSLENDKYYVEMVYNYAKIEVKVNKSDLVYAINNGITILSTIKYDDDIIKNYLGSNNNLLGDVEVLDIFKKSESDNFLKIVEEYDSYEEEDEVPDYDKIN